MNNFETPDKNTNYSFISLDEIITPSKDIFFQAIRDSWWVVANKGLALYQNKYPQCNKTKWIVEKFNFPHLHEIKFFPLVMVPIDIKDYIER